MIRTYCVRLTVLLTLNVNIRYKVKRENVVQLGLHLVRIVVHLFNGCGCILEHHLKRTLFS